MGAAVPSMHCDQICAIFWTLGNFLKPLATNTLPKSCTFLGNFCKGAKIYHFLVKPFLGNFYRDLAIIIWSHCFNALIPVAQGSNLRFFTIYLVYFIETTICQQIVKMKRTLSYDRFK